MPDKPSGIAPSRGWFSRTFLADPITDHLPDVEQPYSWDPQPFVIGDEQLANEAWNILNEYPEARANISKIVSGPTLGSIDYARYFNQPIDKYTDLAGGYSVPERGGDASIGINPRFNSLLRDRSFVLGHEVGHSISPNRDDEAFANEFGRDWRYRWWGK